MEGLAKETAICDGVLTHTLALSWCQLSQLGDQLALLGEELIRLVRAHPGFENLHLLWILVHVWQWNLMCAPVSFQVMTFDLSWSSPSLRRAEHNHGPSRSLGDLARLSSFLLVLTNFLHAMLEGTSKGLVHSVEITALDKVWGVTVARHQCDELLFGDTGKDCRVVDLVTVEMEDRKDCSIVDGVEELVAVPAGGKWASLRLSVSDNGECDGFWVVKYGTKGVR